MAFDKFFAPYDCHKKLANCFANTQKMCYFRLIKQNCIFAVDKYDLSFRSLKKSVHKKSIFWNFIFIFHLENRKRMTVLHCTRRDKSFRFTWIDPKIRFHSMFWAHIEKYQTGYKIKWIFSFAPKTKRREKENHIPMIRE